MRNKSLRLLIITLPVLVLGFFINSLIVKPETHELPFVSVANADLPSGGVDGGCDSGSGCGY